MMKQIMFMVVAATVMMLFAVTTSPANGRDKLDEKVKQDTLAGVKGSCGMCKARIEKTAKGVKGVRAASWEQKSGRLFLTLDPGATKTIIAKELAKVGHDAGDEKAPKAAYDALPACCKYKR
ncbi:MAG: hypothetical protein LBD64_08200 [Odoribacteraceae bacterium]|jgi:Cu(I)/Ag(I) efflux system membrane fusion protein|nr:hypothetical protein [Odoribacteraceae bacterium]